jgi:nucleoside-diphosphate-sugar epimerase
MADKDFCPVILRKGTIFGFSPRMRFDLVVNTFVKDALYRGVITIHYGGEMWRPLIDVRDAARAYIACLEAPEDKVHGQIFNISLHNIRISELALRVQKTLRELNIPCEIHSDYGYKGVRSYRVSAQKIDRVLGVRPRVMIEESVANIVDKIRQYGYTDYDNPRYYNIRWMRLLEEAHKVIGVTGSVFGATPEGRGR